MRRYSYFVLLIIILSSCNQNYIETNQVTLRFSEPMLPDSWIEIDGTVLYHFANDTSSTESKEAKGSELLVPPSLISENPNHVYLPSTNIYNWSEPSKAWLLTQLSNAEMAANYVSSINEWQVKQTESFDILDRIYLFPNNQFELFKGEVTFKRADNEPMKIRKSPNYKATIIVAE